MTLTTIESDILAKLSPERSKITKLYSPSRDCIVHDMPNPSRKLKRGPENIPAMAVEALPLLAKAVIER